MGLTRAAAFVCVIGGSLFSASFATAEGHSPGMVGESDPAFASLEWRCIGPARGGRVQAVSGVVGDPDTYYMGATGGGVWKTTNRGVSWSNITDGFITTGSVGDIAVAEADENVIYLGMGEADIRGNFSHGDGVYRSTDSGKTWAHVGLEGTRQIGRVAVHPTDADTVFVAALGHVFGPNEERGVFKSTDGGATWRKVLYVDDRTGAIDVAFDPNNPRVLFAGMWQVFRTPWSMESGGEGSGLYRSLDGGETWEELTKGLPEGIKGKIGVSPSAAARDLVYAIVEAEEGGVFRSTDGGDSWSRVNEDRNLRQRAWYYTHIIADPNEADTVHVMNVRFHKSVDGGKSFTSVRVPHGDNHDLWIDPLDSERIINANDGGANISFDGGATWSTQTNQPTAQFYRVEVDNSFPYRVYAGQQDNSTASVSSRGREFGNWQRDLYAVGGCECGYVAVHPENPDIVYAGCYGGYLTRYDHSTGEARNISVWPEVPMGDGTVNLRHRFQWTFPIVISPHDPDKVYVGGERVFQSTNCGASWEIISPDLTTNDKSKQGSSGGPITKDNTSVEYYCTVFTIAESPIEAGLIWAGSDDGLIHVTSDGGGDWENVTPAGMGEWPMVSIIEPSAHDADTAYAAVTRYKSNDFAPYIYKTSNRGRSWQKIVNGIGEEDFVRSVREDPEVPGLLYAGTETGVYVSMNDGGTWRAFRGTVAGSDGEAQLPHVPVTDLKVKGDDLVISTQGRSFWIMDDLAPVRQMARGVYAEGNRLFEPAAAYREGWDRVRVHFNLDATPEDEVRLAFYGADGEEIRAYKVEVEPEDAEEEEADETDEGEASEDEGDDEEEGEESDEPKDSFTAKPGMNLFAWNMRHEDPVKVPGAVGWPSPPPGPRVPPGAYEVELRVNDFSARQRVTVLADPRYGTPQSDYDAQYAMLLDVHETLSSAHKAVNTIRAVRGQIGTVMGNAKKAGLDGELKDASKAILDELKAIEDEIIQSRSKSPQDPLNYPIKLNDKIGAIAGTIDGDHAPTKQSRDVFEMLKDALRVQLDRLEVVIEEDVPTFNALVREVDVPVIVVDTDEAP
ncbi:MAG: hypothetical protein RLN60_05690 [Phycisphaerales bacterium]